jgi:hypothetical protein
MRAGFSALRARIPHATAAPPLSLPRPLREEAASRTFRSATEFSPLPRSGGGAGGGGSIGRSSILFEAPPPPRTPPIPIPPPVRTPPAR